VSGRAKQHIMAHPLAGDVFEIVEEFGEHENMIRVICFLEDYVGFKVYGRGGRHWSHIASWRRMLEFAKSFKVVRAGDQDLPF
jgi:hypothetical protein